MRSVARGPIGNRSMWLSGWTRIGISLCESLRKFLRGQGHELGTQPSLRCRVSGPDLPTQLQAIDVVSPFVTFSTGQSKLPQTVNDRTEADETLFTYITYLAGHPSLMQSPERTAFVTADLPHPRSRE